VAQVTECRCRYGGNQYGHYYTFCEEHQAIIEEAAAREGQTVQQFFDDALRSFVEKLERERTA